MADDRNAGRSRALKLLCRGGDRRLRGCIEARLVEAEEDDIASLLGLRRESEQHAAGGRQQEMALHEILPFRFKIDQHPSERKLDPTRVSL